MAENMNGTELDDDVVTNSIAEETVLEINGEYKEDGVEAPDRLIQLPLTRIKHIMKTDPDVTITSQEAVITLAKATELFIQSLAKDSVLHTMKGNRKTLQRRDLDSILDIKDCYAFLEGVLDS